MASYDDIATVSGSVVAFSNGADEVYCKSVKASVAPTMAGVSSVGVVQTGRNIADVSTATKASEQRCSYVFENGGLTITATGTYSRVGFAIPCTQGATYTLSYKGSGDAQYKRVLLYPNALWASASYAQTLTETETAYSTTFTAQSDYIYLGFYLTTTGSTGTETIKDIQIEVGSTDHAYEPYTTPTTYTASLGRTIYGGEVDIVNGEGQETHAKMTFTGADAENWQFSTSGSNYRVYAPLTNAKTGTNTFASNLITPAPSASGYPSIGQGWINNNGNIVIGVDSSITSVSDWKTYLSNNNMEISYELADEYKTDFTFTGQEVPTRLGNNTMYADSGDIEVTYFKSGYGYTSVTVNQKDGNDQLILSATRKFHRVVYEAEVDVINGTGTVYIGESGAEYDPPETITFEPVEVNTVQGTNILYANEGDSVITYRKETE